MKLPAFPDLSPAVLQAVLDRHHLGTRAIHRLPDVGLFNAIFRVGDDLILRIPRQHEAFIAAATKEALAVPAARAAGVVTPELLGFDDSLELLPVPYSLYARVHGDNLGLLELDPEDTPEVYSELGRNLARLHAGVSRHGTLAGFTPEDIGDPREWPEALARDGYLSSLEARWFAAWLEKLEPWRVPVTDVFLHADMQMSNLLVDTDQRFLALLDWGACGWGDPAHDFAGVPLRGVPFMLEGYRAVWPEGMDELMLGRILHRHLQLALFLLRREPQPGRSWAERPQSMMLEVLRFFGGRPDGAWRELYG